MTAQRTPRSTSAAAPRAGFTADEKAAMRERAKELKAESKANATRAEGSETFWRRS
jgi:hypothetical protein